MPYKNELIISPNLSVASTNPLTSYIIEVSVAPQVDGKICGYHALKNGMIAARSFYFNDFDEAPLIAAIFSYSLARVNSPHLIQRLFGSSMSRWKRFIISNRRKKL